MRRVMVAAVTALVLIAAVLLTARLLENGMIFFPAPYPQGEWEPRRIGVVAEEHAFQTADGLTLYGWWFPARPAALPDGRPPGSEPVVLWAHGNAGNLTGRAMHADVLAQHGLSVFVFDYRGYGKSEGHPDEQGIYRDAEAAYAFLTAEMAIAPGRLVLLGRSLGSAPAARLAARLPHAGLVLVSPLPSAARMARLMFGGLPVDLLIRARFPVVEWVRQRRRPLLVIHGERDEIIPLRYGREVFEAAADPKQLVVLPGVGHNDVLAAGGELYVETLVAFAHNAVERPRP